jgi:hypothetical protein
VIVFTDTRDPMPDPRNPYWFRAKRYGWGWGLPATWQGWAVLISWITLLAVVSPFLAMWHLPLFFAFETLMIVALIAICYAKGEPPRWRWGK